MSIAGLGQSCPSEPRRVPIPPQNIIRHFGVALAISVLSCHNQIYAADNAAQCRHVATFDDIVNVGTHLQGQFGGFNSSRVGRVAGEENASQPLTFASFNAFTMLGERPLEEIAIKISPGSA